MAASTAHAPALAVLPKTFDLFLAGQFAGDHESGLISEFEALRSATPPWKR